MEDQPRTLSLILASFLAPCPQRDMGQHVSHLVPGRSLNVSEPYLFKGWINPLPRPVCLNFGGSIRELDFSWQLKFTQLKAAWVGKARPRHTELSRFPTRDKPGGMKVKITSRCLHFSIATIVRVHKQKQGISNLGKLSYWLIRQRYPQVYQNGLFDNR